MKRRYLIVAADGTGARFFSLETADPSAPPGSHPRLVERSDLVNTEHRLHGRDKYSTARPGFDSDPHAGPVHGYDDHRARHDAEQQRRFAVEVATQAVAQALELRATHLVLAAEKRMLGLLRATLDLPVESGIEVHELAKDLTKLSPDEIHEHLTSARIFGAGAG